MSKFVIIRLASGEIIETSIQNFFKMLADEGSYGAVLWKLSAQGSLMVELKSGQALVTRPGCGSARNQIPALTDFVSDATITFSVPARVHVRASSPAEARNLALDYVHGRQAPPPDFGIVLKSDDVESVLGNLEIGNYQGVEEIEITGMSPRRALPLLLNLEHQA
jgi:hypothetical protein